MVGAVGYRTEIQVAWLGQGWGMVGGMVRARGMVRTMLGQCSGKVGAMLGHSRVNDL